MQVYKLFSIVTLTYDVVNLTIYSTSNVNLLVDTHKSLCMNELSFGRKYEMYRLLINYMS